MIASLLLLALVPAALPPGPPDPRVEVVVRERCESRIDRRDLTLYANGTIRLQEGPPGGERLMLREIGHDDVAAIRRRIAAVDLTTVEDATGAPDGDWTPSCRLELATGQERLHEIRYGGFDSGSLALEELRRVVGTLLETVRAEAFSAEIPASYRPAPGDRIERNDGLIFEVVGFTSDGKAIELSAVEQPLQVFVERGRLRVEFRRLLPRGAGR